MQTLHNIDLAPFNTLGIAARAHSLVEIQAIEDLKQLVAARVAFTVLGGGSNVVLSGDPQQVIALMRMRGRALVEETDDAWLVRAEAGENWHELVRWTLASGWPGLENLSLIPGTVGAAPIQNIGAYGVELCERFESLEAMRVDTGAVSVFSRQACRFGYRDSIFKHRPGAWVITAVTLRLPKPWQPVTGYRDIADALALGGIANPAPQQISDVVMAVRQRKLPDWTVLGNAGSFFKNPLVTAEELLRLKARFPDLAYHLQPEGGAKLAAGWLIEYAGWKGRNVGNAGVHDRQALVLVNRGGATGAEMLHLAEQIARDVAQQFGVNLEREPLIL